MFTNDTLLARAALGDSAEPERLQREALPLARALPDIPPRRLESRIRRLAFLVHDEPELAESLYQESLALNRDIYGEVLRNIAYALDNLAIYYMGRGEFDMADPCSTKPSPCS